MHAVGATIRQEYNFLYRITNMYTRRLLYASNNERLPFHLSYFTFFRSIRTDHHLACIPNLTANINNSKSFVLHINLFFCMSTFFFLVHASQNIPEWISWLMNGENGKFEKYSTRAKRKRYSKSTRRVHKNKHFTCRSSASSSFYYFFPVSEEEKKRK